MNNKKITIIGTVSLLACLTLTVESAAAADKVITEGLSDGSCLCPPPGQSDNQGQRPPRSADSQDSLERLGSPPQDLANDSSDRKMGKKPPHKPDSEAEDGDQGRPPADGKGKPPRRPAGDNNDKSRPQPPQGKLDSSGKCVCPTPKSK
ncbi:MAG: hypothetical protein IJ228_01665 [Succinivibrio sp.]|nr:hypothetical protein [Succinivibrio sp.]